MLNIVTMLFFSEGDRGWNIPLPVCPHCEEALEYLSTLSLKAAA